MCLCSLGNVYIADNGNYRIRKVTVEVVPSSQPSTQPTSQPSSQPSSLPSSHPTSQPSTNPSSQPTTQPSTSLVNIAVFSVIMRYQNLDLSDWNADLVHHELLIKASLVKHVAGIREDDIVGVYAVDRSTRRLVTDADNSKTLIPTECEAYILAECAVLYKPSNKETTHQDQRILNIKMLELDITFNIRPQYYNRTNEMTIADVYDEVISHINATSNDVLVDLQSNSTYFTNALVVGTTFSTYSSVIARSSNPTSTPTSYPTSTPTSQPTCGIGSYQVGSGCGPCVPGYYADSLNAFKCTACPLDTYTSIAGSVQCSSCDNFAGNVHEASTSCPHFFLPASPLIYYSLGSFIAVLFLSALLFAGENFSIMFVLGLFPLLDIVSDMVYILSVKFWNFELLICAIIFFVVPSSMFVYKLIRMGAYPHLVKFVGLEIMHDKHIWLGVSPEGFPLINGERSTLLHKEHDSIDKLMWYWVLWLLLLAFQVMFLVICFVWYFLVAVLLVVWLFVGFTLYQTKMLAIGKVWNAWFSTWTQSDFFNKEISLDASVLNESLFHEFMLETVPQIAIQSVNNALIFNGNFPAVSLFSLAMSIFIAVNGVYRYGYYLLWKGIKFDEIPLPLAVSIQKINKTKLFPRRSVFTKKIVSLVESIIKMKDASIPSNIQRMSQAITDANTTTMDLIESLNFHIHLVKLGVRKLQRMQSLESTTSMSTDPKFDEFITFLNIILSNTQSLPDAADDERGDGKKMTSNDCTIVDIGAIARHSNVINNNKIMPLDDENGVRIVDHQQAARKWNDIVPLEITNNTSESDTNSLRTADVVSRTSTALLNEYMGDFDVFSSDESA